jgi:multicomponent Na+:H+ antiporter subunit A
MVPFPVTSVHHEVPVAHTFAPAEQDACGTGFGLFLLRVTQGEFDFTLSDFFARYSYTIAHGRNEVNVILVDFRGLDTLGEIAVVMVAGLAILALIRVRARRGSAVRGEET